MENNRDEFSRTIVEILAKRVGYLCSRPTCRMQTIGPNEIPIKSTSIGIAAHITAASIGGPRYNNELTSEERSHISNGIWLCSNCATLIDKDPEKYTVEILNQWKKEAEDESEKKLNGTIKNSLYFNPILEADLIGGGRSRINMGISYNNPKELYDGQLVIVPGNKPIIHWDLGWRYQLIIYNNSSYPAYNVKIESIGKIHFTEIEALGNTNNLAPLSNISLKVKFKDYIESDHTLADELLRPKYPEKFRGNLIVRITYFDEPRNLHTSIVEFGDDGLINRKE